jgi:hypothetical protein
VNPFLFESFCPVKLNLGMSITAKRLIDKSEIVFTCMEAQTDLQKALHFFELAIQGDPDYAPALADFALNWAMMSRLGWASPEEAAPKARAAALRAIELQPTLEDAYFSSPSYTRVTKLISSYPEAWISSTTVTFPIASPSQQV